MVAEHFKPSPLLDRFSRTRTLSISRGGSWLSLLVQRAECSTDLQGNRLRGSTPSLHHRVQSRPATIDTSRTVGIALRRALRPRLHAWFRPFLGRSYLLSPTRADSLPDGSFEDAPQLMVYTEPIPRRWPRRVHLRVL